MKVYRIEAIKDHTHGPFNPPSNERDEFLAMIYGTRQEMIPAEVAQGVAVTLGLEGPFDMPGILKDGVDEKVFNHFIESVWKGSPVFGFVSMDQYHEWFRTPEIRRALYVRASAGYHFSDPKKASMELREYEVPDAKVIVTPHQVAFSLDDAKSIRVVSRKEAIA